MRVITIAVFILILIRLELKASRIIYDNDSLTIICDQSETLKLNETTWERDKHRSLNEVFVQTCKSMSYLELMLALDLAPRTLSLVSVENLQQTHLNGIDTHGVHNLRLLVPLTENDFDLLLTIPELRMLEISPPYPYVMTLPNLSIIVII